MPSTPRWKHHQHPDHVHLPIRCLHPEHCPADHWVGGRPERTHPHHIEVDVSTGHVGYTRLTAAEIAQL
jgi:hypothetical protein